MFAVTAPGNDCGLRIIGSLSGVSRSGGKNHLREITSKSKEVLLGTLMSTTAQNTADLKELGFMPLTQYRGQYGEYKLTVWIFVPKNKQTTVEGGMIPNGTITAVAETPIRDTMGRFASRLRRDVPAANPIKMCGIPNCIICVK